MRSIFIIFCSLFFCMSFGQEKKYTFYVELDHYSNAPAFKEDKGKLIYIGKDTEEANFFSKYTILEFSQAFPASRRDKTLNYFTVSSYSRDLISALVRTFPTKYLMTEDRTDKDIELANTYPNDYGSSSPVSNSGVAYLKNLDYINAPKAWDYTLGSSDVVIGIADGIIHSSNPDLGSKTTIVDVNYPTGDIEHGTDVSSIAAAQGNNGYGMTGICQNCSIISGRLTYNSILEMAYHPTKPAKIINMSWQTFGEGPYGQGSYSSIHQGIINELYDYGVILVAAAGNTNSFTKPNMEFYSYPGAYDHVISVLTVNHKNTWSEETVMDPTYGEVSRFVEDMISPSVVTNYQGNGPYGFYAGHTSNERVDICAPGYRFFQFYQYLDQGVVGYHPGGGTSMASPHVVGTIGLMLSLYECMDTDEVEDVLQLTSKNLERIQGNEAWKARSGSGKLEAGDATQFVWSMIRSNGNSIIEGSDFYRFDFNLSHINNRLTIFNQTFRDSCTASFTAKNMIEIQPESDFKPNSQGYVDLKVDSNVDVTCSGALPRSIRNNEEGSFEEEMNINQTTTKLFPNPNTGTFEISLGKELKGNVEIEVFDIYGKVVYRNTANDAMFTVNTTNLSSGMYIVRLSYNSTNETIKFVKQ